MLRPGSCNMIVPDQILDGREVSGPKLYGSILIIASYNVISAVQAYSGAMSTTTTSERDVSLLSVQYQRIII